MTGRREEAPSWPPHRVRLRIVEGQLENYFTHGNTTSQSLASADNGKEVSDPSHGGEEEVGYMVFLWVEGEHPVRLVEGTWDTNEERIDETAAAIRAVLPPTTTRPRRRSARCFRHVRRRSSPSVSPRE
jgi:hypothetical protein